MNNIKFLKLFDRLDLIEFSNQKTPGSNNLSILKGFAPYLKFILILKLIKNLTLIRILI